ncbi:MAG: hypothetical protein KC435_01150 [Thermomicrobiales bacterium]|nr:hypothetical protein [Thermomicrobiales bacterium]
MNYEVRYLLNGEEGTLEVEAETAAAAAEIAQQQITGDGDSYELIQVTLLDSESAPA